MAERFADKPLVSIVLPTYKRAGLLAHAIRSVLNQTYSNLELIIVDDNSPDNTPEVVKSFSDKRIRYVRNEPNLRLPRALNKGFSLAQGTYLTWTSDDNLYAADAIEKLVERLQTGNCDLAYADYYLFSKHDAAGHPVDIHHDKLPDSVQLEKGNHIGACFLYTRKVYEETGDYDPELFLVEDYDYFIRAAQRFRFCHIPEPLYYFLRDDNTLYLSRFGEVKASDVLVRYKNRLINEEGLREAVVALLLRNIDGLANPILRRAYRPIRKISFRLTRMHENLVACYLRRRLSAGIRKILGEYDSARMNFRQARDALKDLMQTVGKVEHKR